MSSRRVNASGLFNTNRLFPGSVLFPSQDSVKIRIPSYWVQRYSFFRLYTSFIQKEFIDMKSASVFSVLLLGWVAAPAVCDPVSDRAKFDLLPNFVFVEGGTFIMGDVLQDGNPVMMADVPVHPVTVGNFYLSAYEVTVAEFQRFVDETGFITAAELDKHIKATEAMIQQGFCKYPCWKNHWFNQTPDDPVVWIAWEDAIVYCNWLSRKHGLPSAYKEDTGELLDQDGKTVVDPRAVRGFRLPTEAEWEFAARERGKPVRFGNGQQAARTSEINFDGRKSTPYSEPGMHRDGTTPVGRFAPNALGLYDMSGNAWEWCTDTGLDYTREPRTNPYALTGDGHMIRGGAHDRDAHTSRISTRSNWWRNACCVASGFRVALTAN